MLFFSKIFHYTLIYFNNIFIAPYFSLIGSSDYFYTWPFWLFGTGIYFTVMIGIIMWPILWLYRRNAKKQTIGKLSTLFYSLILSLISFVLFFVELLLFVFLSTYIGSYFGIYNHLNDNLVWLLICTGILIISSITMYFGVYYLQHKNKKAIKWKFNPKLFTVIAGYTITLISMIALVLWITSNSGLCEASDDLYYSSNYNAHSKELCIQRDDKSECPQTAGQLRAFNSNAYDQLQVCYKEKKTIYGYFLVPRLIKGNIF